MISKKFSLPIGGDSSLTCYLVHNALVYFSYQDDETDLNICLNEVDVLFFAIPLDKQHYFNYITDWGVYDFTWLVGGTHEP